MNERSRDIKGLVKLFRYVVREWYIFSASIAMLILASMLSALIPIAIREAIDLGIAKSSYNAVLDRSILVLTLAGLSSLLRLGSGFTGSLAAQRVVHNLRTRAYEALLSKSMKFFDAIPIGHVITRVVNDSDRVAHFLSFDLRMIMNALFLAALSVYYMVSMNLVLTIVCITAVSVVTIVNILAASILRPLIDASRQQIGVLASIATSDIIGIKTVKGLGLEGFEELRYSSENDRLLDLGIKTAKKRTIFANLNFLVFSLTSFIILFYGGYIILRNEMSIGELTAFMSYMAMLIWPTTMLGFMIVNIQFVAVSAKRILDLIESPFEDENNNGGVEVNDIRGEIVFENVSFSYTENSPILKNVSFSVKSGEKIVIIGRPGSGKSTILKLMLKFYRPKEGRILVDGIDIEKISASSLRKVIGYVPQVPFIFNGTIAENIAFGKHGISIDEIAKVSRIAKIDKFIESLPEKYNTVVGERGVDLSGGQRQRLAVARALIHDPKILLLDDPTSNLDAETEKELIEDLKEIVKGKTVVIVTQRPTIAEVADRVLVLESGQIVEEGTMEDLLKRKNLFYKMYVSMIGGRGE